MLRKLDILLRLKAGGIPRHRTAGLGISGLGSQTPKPPHRSNRCGADRWVVSWECHISALASASAPGTPLVCQSRTPTPRVGCASGRPTPTQTSADTDSELLSLRASPSACCLIPTEGTPCFQSGRTLILEPPVSGARLHWGRNHCADIHICAVCGENCVELPL